MKILTVELVNEAIGIAIPTIQRLVELGTWGPKGVVIIVESSKFQGQVIHEMEELGNIEEYTNVHGESFLEIAQAKIRTSLKGANSSTITNSEPWLLEGQDSLHKGGVCHLVGSDYIAIAVSGAYGETDEGIANIILQTIIALCRIKVRGLTNQKIYKVPDDEEKTDENGNGTNW